MMGTVSKLKDGCMILIAKYFQFVVRVPMGSQELINKVRIEVRRKIKAIVARNFCPRYPASKVRNLGTRRDS